MSQDNFFFRKIIAFLSWDGKSCLPVVRRSDGGKLLAAATEMQDVNYVVGDCYAAWPAARTPTTAVGRLRNTCSGEGLHR